MKLKFLLPLAVFGALVFVFLRGLQLDPSEVPSPLIGKPAPAFNLPSLRSPEVMISNQNLTGQVSLLNVWATWCVGCRQEHDALLRIAETGQVPIIGLNYKDDRDAALSWLERLGDPYVANAVDANGAVAIDWGVYGAPETFLIDAEGIVRYKHIGPISMAVFDAQILPRIQQLQAAR